MLKCAIDFRPDALQILPVPFRFTASDVSSAALWGVTGVVGAIYLVQVA